MLDAMNERTDENSNPDRPAEPSWQDNTISLKVDDILAFINANPHLAAQSKDDIKCKVLFSELGMLGLFPKCEGPSLSVVEFPGHPTHWIIGMCWSGYSEPGGNGYGVFCLPKMHVSVEGAKDAVEYIHERYGGHDRQTGEVRVPRQWRHHN